MTEYYFYHNWTAEKGGKAIIHRGDCSFCNNGRGIHNTGQTRNGQWIGPFNTKFYAIDKAKSVNAARVDLCKKCNP